MVVYFIKNNELSRGNTGCVVLPAGGQMSGEMEIFPGNNLVPGTRELPLPVEKYRWSPTERGSVLHVVGTHQGVSRMHTFR